jgi:hypothetical protein
MIRPYVRHEEDLPEVWHRVASCKKQERFIIEEAVSEAAEAATYYDSAPVITPGLAKSIVNRQFVGADIDNLAEGIRSFTPVVNDMQLTDASEQL